MRVYRLTKSRYARSAFEGTGSRLVGGRWNSPGRSVVYPSTHASTAVLKILVHVHRAELLRDAYMVIETDVPDELVLDLDIARLPDGWDAMPETAASTAIGDEWFDTAASVALRVPSAVMRGQLNVLLNPNHPHWDQLVSGVPQPFLFEARLGDEAGPR